MSTLTTDAQERKATPIYSGFVKYFPLAMAAVAQCSKAGNDQHNPGKPLHWDRSKSGDELDALQRHLMEAGTVDTDGIRHSAKVAWRAMANLEKEIERELLREERERETGQAETVTIPEGLFKRHYVAAHRPVHDAVGPFSSLYHYGQRTDE